MVALDGAGNLFVADSGNNRVVKVPANGGTEVVLSATGLNMPLGVAVDGAGNVFIADTNNSRILELPASGGPQIAVAASGLNHPFAVAVDAAGDLFIADYGNQRVLELPVSGGGQITVGSGLTTPESLAVDAAGDVFVADTINERVVEISPGSGAQTTVGSGWLNPTGVSVDQTGNVFVADPGITLVADVQRSQAPTLTFATTNVGSVSTDSPRSVTVTNIGNTNLTLSGLTVGTNFVKVAGSGAPADCSASTSLAPGATCNLSFSFTPAAAGTLSSTATLTDNALNASGATQAITLQGSTLTAQTITFGSIPGFASAGSSLAVSATSTSGGAVTFGTSTLPVCSVSSGGSVSFVQVGTCTINASVAATGSYAAASASVNVTVFAAQTISFGTIPTQTVGTPLPLTATASSGLAVSYSASPATVCTVTGSNVSFVAAGTCSINASQAGDGVNYGPAAPVTQTFSVVIGGLNPGSDPFTQGTWTGTYGTDGYLIANEPSALPSYATVTVTGDATWTWVASTTAGRALQTASGATTRIASTYYSGTTFAFNLNITDGKTHRVALYLVDWDSTLRAETVSLIDAASQTALNTQTVSNFHNGVWVSWDVSGNVVIQVTDTSGANAVVSGIFFDPVPAAATAKYVGTDTVTQGTWTGVHGVDGNIIATETAAPPSYATVSVNGSAQYTWAASTSDVRGLQTSGGASTRMASTYYAAGRFTIDVNVTDGNTHRIGLYLLDWDSNARAETITVTDANTHAVLDTETYSNFNGGAYVMWDIKGSVTIEVTDTSGANAVVAGLFFDPTPAAAPATASYVATDTTTQGAWTGKYGSTGQLIANGLNNPPSFGTVSLAGDSLYTWNGSTIDPRALQVSNGATSGIASTYYAWGTFTISVNLTDGNAHKLSLYLLDWDSTARAETITVIDGASHATLDSQSYSSFNGGEWAVWNVTGSVTIQVTGTSGANAVVSGIFVD